MVVETCNSFTPIFYLMLVHLSLLTIQLQKLVFICYYVCSFQTSTNIIVAYFESLFKDQYSLDTAVGLS